jgi:hypothetical protein
MTDVYLRLDYRQYKLLEQQLRHWEQVETTHTSVDGYYHKALRLDLGDITLEVQGPAVKAPIRHEEPEEAIRVSDPRVISEGRLVAWPDPDGPFQPGSEGP